MGGNVAGLHFRYATRSDVPDVVRLIADDEIGATRDTYDDPLPEEYLLAFDQMEAERFNKIILAEIDGKIIGCLTLTLVVGLGRRGMTRAQIESVRIDKSLRSQGIGAALMQHAIDLAREMNCGLVQLATDNCRVEAHSFYGRLGFVAGHVGMKLIL